MSLFNHFLAGTFNPVYFYCFTFYCSLLLFLLFETVQNIFETVQNPVPVPRYKTCELHSRRCFVAAVSVAACELHRYVS